MRGHGFLDTNGSFANVDYPQATTTIALGINPGLNTSNRMIVGVYINNGATSGFLDTNGSFSTLADPAGTLIRPTGINDSGQIVGLYVDSNGTEHGFLATST
jgi:hypothetical protein